MFWGKRLNPADYVKFVAGISDGVRERYSSGTVASFRPVEFAIFRRKNELNRK